MARLRPLQKVNFWPVEKSIKGHALKISLFMCIAKASISKQQRLRRHSELERPQNRKVAVYILILFNHTKMLGKVTSLAIQVAKLMSKFLTLSTSIRLVDRMRVPSRFGVVTAESQDFATSAILVRPGSAKYSPLVQNPHILLGPSLAKTRLENANHL